MIGAALSRRLRNRDIRYRRCDRPDRGKTRISDAAGEGFPDAASPKSGPAGAAAKGRDGAGRGMTKTRAQASAKQSSARQVMRRRCPGSARGAPADGVATVSRSPAGVTTSCSITGPR